MDPAFPSIGLHLQPWSIRPYRQRLTAHWGDHSADRRGAMATRIYWKKQSSSFKVVEVI